ncbi:MAG: LamG domain-containing protein, partial [Bacteroidetes bacterium]|nr:LamG domain-containing protein [Bacteroidota bacterium]
MDTKSPYALCLVPFLLCLFITINSFAQQELYLTPLYNDANLVSYWRFEGNGNDSKGNNNGTNSGGVSFGNSFGKFEQGAGFDGSSYISAPNSASLSITGDMTINFWFYSPNVSSNTRSEVIAKWQSSGSNLSFLLYHKPNSGRFIFNHSNNGSATVTNEFIQTNSDIVVNTWNMVTLVKSGTTGTFYINGIPATDNGQALFSSTYYSSATSLYIGVRNDGGLDSYMQNGDKLDDLSLFSRALTPSEISNLYTGNWPQELYITPLFYDANLVSYWRLEGNSNDAVGPNNGTTQTAITYNTANGEFAQGAGFNGTSSKIDCGHTGIPSGSSARTVSFWFYLPSGAMGQQNQAVTWGELAQQKLWSCGVDGNNHVWVWGGWGDCRGVTAVTPNTWHHAVYTYDGTTQKVYLDGNFEASNIPTILNTTATDVSIGNSQGYFGTGNASKIDDVAIFSRALITTEINHLYSGFPPSYAAVDWNNSNVRE